MTNFSSVRRMPSGARPVVAPAPEAETKENATARAEYCLVPDTGPYRVQGTGRALTILMFVGLAMWELTYNHHREGPMP